MKFETLSGLTAGKQQSKRRNGFQRWRGTATVPSSGEKLDVRSLFSLVSPASEHPPASGCTFCRAKRAPAASDFVQCSDDTMSLVSTAVRIPTRK